MYSQFHIFVTLFFAIFSAKIQLSAVTRTTSDSQPGQGEGGEATTVELPKASDEALQFIQDIEEEDFKHLLFTDSLVIVSDTGKELGEFVVTIEPAKFHEETDCFLVHANSHGAIDNVPCGTSITSYVSKKLETLEQQHHEYVKLENHPLDRKTFIVKQDNEYVVTRVISQGDDVQRSAQTFTEDNMKGFVSEGSNLLLQRLLIKKGLGDNFQFLSFDSDTNLCPAVYKPLDLRTQVVQETEVEVTGLERTINSISDLPTTWQVYFTDDGHLTSRVQVGSPVTMRLLVVPKPIEEEEEPDKPVFGKKELNWEEDMQLHSQFLDRKEELKGDHAVYMRHHPELKAILADFLQFLLLRKPDDVIAFAADYFSSFSMKMPSPPAYLQSTSGSPFSNTTASPKIKHLAQFR